jgi:hypothetical protein
MRTVLLIAALVLAAASVWLVARSRGQNVSAKNFALSSFSASKKPDFNSEIKPIFQARCQPCHFQGGQVYDKMPFDKPETITRLGTKLFTRIKDEKERALIRQFLDQP